MKIILLICTALWILPGCSDTPKVEKQTTTVYEYEQPEKTTTTTVETKTE
jgi:hypothetical protein